MFNGLLKINTFLDKESRSRYLLLVILLIIKAFLDGLGLGLIAPFLASITNPSLIFNNEIFKLINIYIGIETTQQLVLFMSVVLIIFFTIKNIFILFVIYYQNRIFFSDRAYKSKELFQDYISAPYDFYLEHNTAELDRNIRFEIPKVYTFIKNIMSLVSDIFMIIAIAIVLAIASWQAVLSISVLLLFLIFVVLYISGGYSNKLGIEDQKSQLHLGQSLQEGFSTIVETKLGNMESFFPMRYLKQHMILSKSNWRQVTIESASPLILEIFSIGILVSVMFVISFRGIDIVDVLPVIGIFSYAFIRLIPVVSSVIKSLQNIKYIMPAIDVIYSEFNQFNGEKKYNKSNKEQRHLFKKVIFSSIKLNSVVFFFGTKKKVNIINNLTLQIDKGQVIGISGPSGSGKTTLMNIVLGLLKPNEGRVLVNDKDIQEDLVGWRSLIGYVPQSITLIDASIRSNVALGIEDDAIDNEKIWSVLKEASLFEFVKNLPFQLDTFIGENGIRTSGGQRQRLGLARALYHDPEVMVFDEATSALDIETEKRITGEIMKLSGKRTVIIVAHRISTIKECDVIYYMKGGEIVNFGTYNELKELNIPGFMNDKSES